MEKTRFLTEKEKARNARNAQIRSEYAQMRKAFPSVADNRLHIELARKYKMSSMMIRLICIG